MSTVLKAWIGVLGKPYAIAILEYVNDPTPRDVGIHRIPCV